jgi:hypothetical protein
MLGDTGEHLDIDMEFVELIKQERWLESSHILIEWLDANPLGHSDPRYAPVANIMFLEPDECVKRIG